MTEEEKRATTERDDLALGDAEEPQPARLEAVVRRLLDHLGLRTVSRSGAGREAGSPAEGPTPPVFLCASNPLGAEEIAAADGVLPFLMLEAERLWNDATRGHLGISLAPDPKAFCGVRLATEPRAPLSLIALLVDRVIEDLVEGPKIKLDRLLYAWLPRIELLRGKSGTRPAADGQTAIRPQAAAHGGPSIE